MIKAIIKDKEYSVEFDNSGNAGNINDDIFQWDILTTGDRKANVIYKGQSFNLILEHQEGNDITLRVNGKKVLVKTRDKLSLLLESMGLNVATEQKINHVKAHTDNSNPRSYVNNWCDQEAKKALYGYNF